MRTLNFRRLLICWVFFAPLCYLFIFGAGRVDGAGGGLGLLIVFGGAIFFAIVGIAVLVAAICDNKLFLKQTVLLTLALIIGLFCVAQGIGLYFSKETPGYCRSQGRVTPDDKFIEIAAQNEFKNRQIKFSATVAKISNRSLFDKIAGHNAVEVHLKEFRIDKDGMSYIDNHYVEITGCGHIVEVLRGG